jgi:phosphatidylinositol alpha-1,6-mannosyltransferase
MSQRARMVLVCSGLGTATGGVGVVAQLVHRALKRRAEVTVWQHAPFRGRLERAARLLARSIGVLHERPKLVVYTHVDLARLHVLNPLLWSIPSALVLHGTEMWRPVDALRRRAVEQAQVRIAVSEKTLALMRLQNPWLPHTQVAWPGVPDRPAEAGGERPRVALIVARMDASERQKGHDAILDAWGRVRTALPDAELRVVGEGSDRARLEERVQQERLQGVHFLGSVDDRERTPLYREARLFVFPSLQEGFGLAAVEAAQMATPVLAVRGTVLEEILPDSLFVDAPTGEQLAPAIIDGLSNDARVRELGTLSRQRVQAHLLEEHFFERFDRVMMTQLT